MIDWSSISPEEFERLCAELLEFNGFENIEWYGRGGGDKGRDLLAERFETPLPGVRRARTWIVQCKRYTEKSLGKGELTSFFNAAREHRPDVALVITTATLTADVRDWLKAVQADYSFEIYVWEERDLAQQVRIHRRKLTAQLQILPWPAEPRLYYPMAIPGQAYMMGSAGEFEEVGFYLLNSYGPERDQEILRRFVEYLRHHEVDFRDGDADE
jgi:hypothetical protein